jgi:hypothetical protein
MKFIILPLALFSLLIDERESSLTSALAGGVDLCKLLLKHEAELFIRDLRYAVGRQLEREKVSGGNGIMNRKKLSIPRRIRFISQ